MVVGVPAGRAKLDAKAAIKSTTDETEIDKAVNDYKKTVDEAFLNKKKSDAKKEITDYRTEDIAALSDENKKATIEELKTTWKETIDSQTTESGVQTELANAKTAIDAEIAK